MFFLTHLIALSSFNIYSVLTFWQNDYIVKYEHINVEYVNPEAFECFYWRNVKPNRTHKAFSIRYRLLFDIPDNNSYKANLKIYKLTANSPEFLLFQYDIKICECLKKRMFGIDDVFRSGNFSTCPIKRGYYYVNNWTLDYHKLPPNIPGGRYKIVVNLLLDTKTLATATVFLELVYQTKS